MRRPRSGVQRSATTALQALARRRDVGGMDEGTTAKWSRLVWSIGRGDGHDVKAGGDGVWVWQSDMTLELCELERRWSWIIGMRRKVGPRAG